jgi:Zn-dependent protease/CBS domain-containing protein
MKWSWRLGRLFDIDVFVHATFLILLAWVGMSHYQREGNVHGALVGVAFILAVFGTVVLHEFGHALAARRFGIKTKDITLYPIGGVARLERMPEKPGQELLVALAGPAVNVVIAAVLFGFLKAAGQQLVLAEQSIMGGGPFLTKLLWVNVTLAVFNLLPAFPMDGGRALRALLALRGDYVGATRMAAGIGQGMALLLGLLGLFSNPFLVFIALFVWIGAAAESGAVQTKAALTGLPIQAAMVTQFRVLAAHDSLATASQALLAGSQLDFPVVDESGVLVGVLTRTNLIRGLTASGPTAVVETVMTRRFETADPGEMLDGALARLQGCECSSLPVVRHGNVLGIVTMENIGELMMVQDAMRAARQGRRRKRECRMNEPMAPRAIGDRLVLDVAGFAALLEQLRATGHQVVGPTVRDGAIIT